MNEFLEKLLRYIDSLKHIEASEFPEIRLYMDQVTGLMEDKLGGMKRYPQDKILTKTMINNYTKNKLLAPPEKKKYNKDHLVLLIFIYYFKGFMSLDDIKTLLSPLKEMLDEGEEGLSEIYDLVFSMSDQLKDSLKEDLEQKYNISMDLIKTLNETKEAEAAAEKESEIKSGSETDTAEGSGSDKEKQRFQVFFFLCALGYDIYLKKHIMEKMLDYIRDQD